MVIYGNIWYMISIIYIYIITIIPSASRVVFSSCRQVLKVLKAWAFGRNFGRLNVMPDGHLVGQWLGKCWMVRWNSGIFFEKFWWLGKWWNYPSFMDYPPFIHHLSTMKSSTVPSQIMDTNSVAQHRGNIDGFFMTDWGQLMISWWINGGESINAINDGWYLPWL